MKKYNAHKINSNYINYHNNQQRQITEVLITNYLKSAQTVKYKSSLFTTTIRSPERLKKFLSVWKLYT